MIYIILDGGLIQNICDDQDESTRGHIRTVDYDVDGLNDEDVIDTEQGDSCYTGVWTPEKIEVIKPMVFKKETDDD